jgi:hypothetical protein
MCERHYRRWLKRGDTSAPTHIDNLARCKVTGAGCWRWLGAMWPNGYGKTSVAIHGTQIAHRVFYIEHNGPVPDGLDLDHRCRNRWCVNPKHLEPVSRAENLDRGHLARITCKSGRHDITLPGALRPGTRQCIECWRGRYRTAGARYRARLRQA